MSCIGGVGLELSIILSIVTSVLITGNLCMYIIEPSFLSQEMYVRMSNR